MYKRLTVAILLACAAFTSGKNSDAGSNIDDPNDAGNGNEVTGIQPGGGGTVDTGDRGNNVFPTGPSLAPDSSYIQYIGRVEPGAPGGVRLAWGGTGFRVRLSNATSLTVGMIPNQYGENNIMGAYIDDVLQKTYPVQGADPTALPTSFTVPITSGEHIVTIIKRTEAGNGMVLLTNLTTDGQFEVIANSGRKIEVVGENAVAGYSSDAPNGVTACAQPANSVASPTQQNAASTFGVLTAKNFNASWSLIAASGRGLTQNFDGSKRANMNDLYARLNPMDATSEIGGSIGADAVIINVGFNDVNYWLQNKLGVAADPASYTAAYVALVKKIRALNATAAIIATVGPTAGDYQCIGSTSADYGCRTGGGQPVLTTWRNATQAAVTQLNQAGDSKVSFVEIPADSTNVGACYMPSAQGHTAIAQVLTPAIASATSWSVGSGAVAQPALAKAGTGPKALTGTFAPHPDVLKSATADSGINNKEFPQCHYCSPQPFNANNVGTPACPALVGEQFACEGYCHVPDGFAELYHSDPPTSGNHYAAPKTVTLNSVAVPRGKWIHSMEHGAIVLSYNCPQGCSAEVARMEALFNKYRTADTTKSLAWVIVTPDPLLKSGKFAASSWTWNLVMNSFEAADAARTDCFIQQHAFYGRECLVNDPTANPRNCPNLVDKPMFTNGG